jgi:hypothetical protein
MISTEHKKLIAIMIAIENLIRINQTLIKKTIIRIHVPGSVIAKMPGFSRVLRCSLRWCRPYVLHEPGVARITGAGKNYPCWPLTGNASYQTRYRDQFPR